MTANTWLGRACLCAGAVLAAAAHYSCGGSPTAPSPAGPAAEAKPFAAAEGVVGQGEQNSPPVLELRTRPVAVPGDPHPVIAGAAPLTVSFNLCRSEDPDQVEEAPDEGDSLNWQFHFGDDDTEPFAPDGSFNANFAHFCRTEHTYEEGRYVATVSVTDKHLEDQGRGVAALARVTQQISIDATGPASDVRPSCLGTISDSLDGSESTFNRPNCPGGPPGCTLSGVGTAVFLDTFGCSMPGGPVTIDLNGTSVDTYLVLYSSFARSAPTGGIAALNDDFGSTTRSQISGTFPAGNYVIVVTSFNNGQTFNYTLNVTSP